MTDKNKIHQILLLAMFEGNRFQLSFLSVGAQHNTGEEGETNGKVHGMRQRGQNS